MPTKITFTKKTNTNRVSNYKIRRGLDLKPPDRIADIRLLNLPSIFKWIITITLTHYLQSICVSPHTHTHVYIWLTIHINKQTNTHTHKHAETQTQTQTNKQTQTHKHAKTHTHTYVYIYDLQHENGALKAGKRFWKTPSFTPITLKQIIYIHIKIK